MEDLEFYKYRKEAFEKDKRIQQQKRLEALQEKYLNKRYVGNSQMMNSAYEADRDQMNKELAGLNAKDASKLQDLHFGEAGISGVKQEMVNNGRLESLKEKWLDQTKDQDNKPATPEVFTKSAEQQQAKEKEPERSELSKEFKETNQGMDMN